jgi:hypothetical protein
LDPGAVGLTSGYGSPGPFLRTLIGPSRSLAVCPQSTDRPVAYNFTPVVPSARPGSLGHHNTKELLFGVDPEISAGVTSPNVLALRFRNGREARFLSDGETEAEGVALCADEQFARLHHTCHLRTAMI